MRLVCLGECLAPAIANGTVIEAESAPPQSLRSGDLVVFSANGVYVCHRLLYRRQEDGLWWFFLKADNTGIADGWIPEYRIVGKVLRVADRSRETAAVRRDDLRRLWRSRLGYAVYRLRRLAQWRVPQVIHG